MFLLLLCDVFIAFFVMFLLLLCDVFIAFFVMLLLLLIIQAMFDLVVVLACTYKSTCVNALLGVVVC